MAVDGRLEFIEKEMYVDSLGAIISVWEMGLKGLQQANRKNNRGHAGEEREQEDGGEYSKFRVECGEGDSILIVGRSISFKLRCSKGNHSCKRLKPPTDLGGARCQSPNASLRID